MTPHTGRRVGESGTRTAILMAARSRFGEHGYDHATIRGIAADAGVDPALVHHFYGTKEALFAAAMELPVMPGDVLTEALASDPESPGTAIVRAALAMWEAPETRHPFLGLLRSALSNDRAAAMLREFVRDTILRRLADVLDHSDAEYRAALVGSQIVGLGLARYVVALEPLASADVDDIVAAVGPTIQRYLTADLSTASAQT